MKTIQYMGSKKALLLFIEDSINDYIQNNDVINTFYDAFSGSGRIAHYFSKKYNIISSDKQSFSKIILDAYLNTNINISTINNKIKELNNLPIEYFEETDKWFTKNYSCSFNDGISIGKDGNPKIWLEENAMKIDMIRTKIDDINFLKNTKKDKELKNVLLLSLILSVNKVSNVVGHQNGYLKKWSINAQNKLLLINPFDSEDEYKNRKLKAKNIVGDIFDILPTITSDITYFDPPYGTNNENLSVATRYSSFYHLWNTLVNNDRPELFGKAGKPIETKGWTPDLEKNKKEVIIPKFIELINLSNSKYVAFSYSNQGLLTKEEFISVFEAANCNDIRCYEQKHKINTQSKTAIKDGKFVNRDQTKKELVEYFFIGTKN